MGLGKTHLMHAIGHFVLRAAPAREALLHLGRAVHERDDQRDPYDRILEFRERYRGVDVLLIDDIQFLVGKERTQEEFFHTFNALHDAQNQIVLSSDRPPHQITELEERLRTRFEWGVMADIQPPDLETRIAILKRKAETEGVPLPDDVALFIASRIKSNIRELEGSLIRLLAYASLTGRELSMSLAQESCATCFAARDKGGHDRRHSEVRADYYKLKLARSEVAQQLEVHSDAAPGRDVSLQVAHERVAAGNREELRRQTSLDGHPLHPQGGGTPAARRGFQQPYQHLRRAGR